MPARRPRPKLPGLDLDPLLTLDGLREVSALEEHLLPFASSDTSRLYLNPFLADLHRHRTPRRAGPGCGQTA